MKRIFLILMLATSCAAQTTVTMPGTVKYSGVGNAGINIGQFYGSYSEDFFSDFLFAQGGNMQSVNYQLRLYCNSGGTIDTTHWYNSATSSQGYPANFWVGATYTAVNEAGAIMGTGTVTASSANTSTGLEITLGSPLTATCSPSNQDILVMRQLIPNYTVVTPQLYYRGTYTSVASDAVFVQGDVASGSGNTVQSLELPSNNDQLKFSFDGSEDDANTDITQAQVKRPWVNLNGTYTMGVWAKSVTSGSSLQVIVNRLGSATYANCTVTPTYNTTPGAGWAYYYFSGSSCGTSPLTMTLSESGAQQPTMQITLIANGGGILLQGAHFIETNQLSGNTSIYRDWYVKYFRDHNPGTCRFMAGGDWGADPLQQMGPDGNNNFTNFSTYAPIYPLPAYGFSNEIKLANVVGCDAHIVVSMYAPPTEMATFAADLAADANYQALVARGGRLYLEIGNEPWNTGVDYSLFSGVGSAYGTYAGLLIAAFQASSSYDPAHEKFVMGGWTVSGNNTGTWTSNAMTTALAQGAHVDYLDAEFYTLNNLATVTTTGTSGPSGTGVIATGDNSPWVDMFAEDANLSSSTVPSSPNTSYYAWCNFAKTTYSLGCLGYEGNTSLEAGTYPFTQLQIDQIEASVGGGLGTVLAAMQMQQFAGFGPINYFTATQNTSGYNCTNCNSSTITTYSTSGTTTTLTGANGFGLGQRINFNISSGPTYLNGQRYEITTPLSSTEFSVVDASSTGSGSVSGSASSYVHPPEWGMDKTGSCGPAQIAAGTCTYIDRPKGQLMEIVNAAFAGKTNVMNISASGPTYSYAGGQNIGYGNSIAANSAVPDVQIGEAKCDGSGNCAVVLVNSTAESQAVSFTGAGAPSGTITNTIYPSSSNVITDHNENSTPTSSSQVVSIPSSGSGLVTTIPAFSALVMTYSTSATAATPTFSPAAGTYTGTQTVTLSTSTSGCGSSIVWNTSGASSGGNLTGTTTGTSVTVATSETVYAQVQGCSGYSNSAIGSAAYTISNVDGSQVSGTVKFSGSTVQN